MSIGFVGNSPDENLERYLDVVVPIYHKHCFGMVDNSIAIS